VPAWGILIHVSETQETSHTTVNTSHQTPHRTSDNLDTINEFEEEEMAAAEAAES
jgi:hypothetical protein